MAANTSSGITNANGIFVNANGVISNYSNISDPVYVTSGLFLDRLNEKQFQILIPSFVLVLTAIVVGVLGNIITAIVYIKKMRRTSSRLYIIALTLCDLVNCVFTMPLELVIILQFWTFDYPAVCSVGRSFTYIFNGASALLLCCIAIDRYRKICRPLKPLFTSAKIKSLCVLSVAVAGAFYIPSFLFYGTQTFKIPLEVNSSRVIIVAKTCSVNDKYTQSKLVQFIMGSWFLATVIILIVMTVFYSLIGHAIYKRLKLEEKRHNSVSSQVRRKSRPKVVADQSSETSCSFDGIVHTKGVSPVLLKTMSAPVRSTISKSLKNRFSLSKSNTVYAVKNDLLSKRIRVGRTTLMLFFVTIAYVLSFIPFITIMLIRTAKPEIYITLDNTMKSIWNAFLRSYVLNCAVNPLLYGFFNKEFRKRLVELFRDIFRCDK